MNDLKMGEKLVPAVPAENTAAAPPGTQGLLRPVPQIVIPPAELLTPEAKAPQLLGLEETWLTEADMEIFFLKTKPEENAAYCEGDGIGLSILFAETVKDAARFNETARRWYCYNGVVWEEDREDLRIGRYAQMFAVTLALYAYNKDPESRFTQKAEKLKALSKRTELIRDARSIHPFREEQLDEDPMLFNCLNGVLHLDTLELTPHDPALLLSKHADAAYDPMIQSDLFDTFLFEVMQRDLPKTEALLMALGYSLLGTAPLHCCFLLFGETTRNGKSTLTETIRKLFGGYGATVEPQTLAVRQESASAARGDLAKLRGVRFLQMSEPPRGMHFDAALLKKLTGQDTITARHLYQREVEFTPAFKLFINTNYLPVVSDNTLFSGGRIRVFPFGRHFKEEEQDRTLPQRLREPETLSGILNRLVDGLRLYYGAGNRLPLPESVKEATEGYAEDSDKLRCFSEERLMRDPAGAIPLQKAYTAYSEWCRESGYGTENKSNFTKELRKRGLLTEKAIRWNGRICRNMILGFQLTDG